MGQIGSTSYVLPIRLSYHMLNSIIRVDITDIARGWKDFLWYSTIQDTYREWLEFATE